MHSSGGGIAAEERSQSGAAHDDRFRRNIIMNTIPTLSAHPPANANLTAKSDTPLNAGGRSNQLRHAHPCRMSTSADWTAVKVLTLGEMCEKYIQWMLNRCGGNRVATAQLLGIGRTSLYRYLKKLDCKKERVQPGTGLKT